MDMEILIDLNFLVKNSLSINEYLTLYKIYLFSTQQVVIPFKSDFVTIEGLVTRGLLDKDASEMYGLSEIATSFFELKEDLFEEFYMTFPNRVPDGKGGWRPVSTNDIKSKAAQRTKLVWKKHVGNHPEKQRMVIDGLKAELSAREKSNNLMYLNNIDTWLRQTKWEQWIHNETNDSGNNNIIRL